ncbi:MAG: sigma-70 family RNA polymerase sigma factor [Phycisphaerales bacterium]|nr:sigma-70 family RNA polymerase sigma factor [Phycisphaerales bacterium]
MRRTSRDGDPRGNDGKVAGHAEGKRTGLSEGKDLRRVGDTNPGPSGIEDCGPSDIDLIRKVQGGEASSFGLLVTRYQDRVHNTCWRICGNTEDARDLTQEAFLNAFRRLGDFRLDSRFYTWLFRIAVNLAISHRRKMKHRAAIPLDGRSGGDGEDHAALGASIEDRQEAAPDEAVAQGELRQRLAAGLRMLDEDHRAVVVLRDIEGLDYARIAEILDVPVGTVRSRLHRGRQELAALVQPAERTRAGTTGRT